MNHDKTSHDRRHATTPQGGLSIAPSLEDTLPRTLGKALGNGGARVLDRRVLFISAVAIGIAMVSALIARLLTTLIGLSTNLAYYGRFSTSFVSPAHNHLGWLAVLVPVIGGLIVGIMARYGSRAIRGHGIPEAMEQVLTNGSRIPPKITWLKPLSSAVAIGTGGPFGAEGPIIATGGALGSLIGQVLHTTSAERKTLLAAGAAAGMTATFGSPIAAVLLAVELLLFEFRPRSLIPVALACVTAAGIRSSLLGTAPVFAMPGVAAPGEIALVFYVALGLATGVLAVGVTRLVYAVEDAFEKLPIHWMWWPALGGLVVGLVGLVAPRTLGVGYDNIEGFVTGASIGQAALALCVWKLVSWAIALGSGTSGGTLAPLFTIGGGFGAVVGGLAIALAPHAGIDVRLAALVGMAAIFAGASRAFLTAVVFAFETTLQPAGLMPLLGGCAGAYLVSCLLMRNTIMTEKIARRGVVVPGEYVSDHWEQVPVRSAGVREVVTLAASDTLASVRLWLETREPGSRHQGYPVLDDKGRLTGVVTRRDLLDGSPEGGRRIGDLVKRAPVTITEDRSLREAADFMVREGVGRLPVMAQGRKDLMVGILTRRDLISAHGARLADNHTAVRHIRLRAALNRRWRRISARVKG
jgi:CIC family chloride channel protein